MTHARQQIREAVVALLAPVPAPVYDSRVREFEQTDLPFVNVLEPESTEESVRMDTSGTLERRAQLVVEIGVRELYGLDAQQALDSLTEAVEIQLSSAALKNAVPNLKRWWLIATETMEPVVDSDQVLQAVSLSYLAEYYTADGQPGQLD